MNSNFKIFFEKIKNPLRKDSLKGVQSNMEDYKQFIVDYKKRIISGNVKDEEEQKVHDAYVKFKKNFPERADAWLSKEADRIGKRRLLKNKLSPTDKKLFVKMGIPVYLDKYVEVDFSVGKYGHRMINRSIEQMLIQTRGILPKKRPTIVITDRHQNELFLEIKNIGNVPAIIFGGIIYVDQYNVDQPNLLIHEFAHYVVGLIPAQSKELLQTSYNEMLDFYWKRAKVKKMSLDARKADDENLKKVDKMREKISKKLGFPQYGLSNPDEFFAVMIENWNELPKNAATYRYKTLVKKVLNRL